MNHPFQRVLKLIKKTGDKFVIYDEQLLEGYVIMSLNSYEKLVEHVGNNQTDVDGKSEPDFELWHTMGEKVHSEVSKKTINKESELIPGLETEVVDISGEVPPILSDEGKFFFEDIDENLGE